MEKEKPINNPDPSRPPFTYLPFQTPVSLEALLRPLLHHLRTPGIGPHEWKRITFDRRCSPRIKNVLYFHYDIHQENHFVRCQMADPVVLYMVGSK